MPVFRPSSASSSSTFGRVSSPSTRLVFKEGIEAISAYVVRSLNYITNSTTRALTGNSLSPSAPTATTMELPMLTCNTRQQLNDGWIVGCDADLGGESEAFWGLTEQGSGLFYGNVSTHVPKHIQNTIKQTGYAGIRSKVKKNLRVEDIDRRAGRQLPETRVSVNTCTSRDALNIMKYRSIIDLIFGLIFIDMTVVVEKYYGVVNLKPLARCSHVDLISPFPFLQARPFTLLHRPVWDTTIYRYLAVRAKGDTRQWFVNLQTASSLYPTFLYQHKLIFQNPGKWETVLVSWTI